MTQEELDMLCETHKSLLEENVDNVDIVPYANFRGKELNHLSFIDNDLRRADFTGARINDCYANYTKLNDSIFTDAVIINSCFKGADFTDVNLSSVVIHNTNFSGAKGIESSIDVMDRLFESTDEGYIVYKVFNLIYGTPPYWDLTPCSIINENVDFDRCNLCSYGINVSTLDWIKRNDYHYSPFEHSYLPIWKCLIRWKWLAGVCAPYGTDGPIRCERLELIDTVK